MIFENYSFRKADYFNMLNTLRKDKDLLLDEKNKAEFVKCCVRYSLPQVPLRLYSIYLNKADKLFLINSIRTEEQMREVIDSLDRINIDPYYLIDKACELDLDYYLVNKCNDVKPRFIETMANKTNNINTLNSLLKFRFKNPSLEIILNKLTDMNKEVKEKETIIDINKYLKNNSLQEKRKKQVVAYLLQNDRYEEIINVINEYNLDDLLVFKVLRTNNFDLINRININVLNQKMKDNYLLRLVTFGSIKDLIDFKNKYNNKDYNRFIIEELTKKYRYDDVVKYSKNIVLVNESKEDLVKSIDNCNIAYELYDLSVNNYDPLVINKIGEKLCKIGNVKYMYLYLKNSKGYSNEVKQKLVTRIVKSKVLYYICLTALFIDTKLITILFKNKINMYRFMVNSNMFEKEILDYSRKVLIEDKKKFNIMKDNIYNNIDNNFKQERKYISLKKKNN